MSFCQPECAHGHTFTYAALPPVKMDIFNPCFPLGGKGKSCQAENETSSNAMSVTARKKHLYI